jgi:hypothetical protein
MRSLVQSLAPLGEPDLARFFHTNPAEVGIYFMCLRVVALSLAPNDQVADGSQVRTIGQSFNCNRNRAIPGWLSSYIADLKPCEDFYFLWGSSGILILTQSNDMGSRTGQLYERGIHDQP